MSKVTNFNTMIAKSKLKLIKEKWGDKHLTVKQAANEIGIPHRSLYCFVSHLRESGSLVEVGRTGGIGGGVTIVYAHTSIYAPIAEEWGDVPSSHAARTPVIAFRHWMDVALFGEAKPCAV